MKISRRRFLQGAILLAQCRFTHAASAYARVKNVAQIKDLDIYENQIIFAEGYYFPEKESALFYRVVKTRVSTPLQPHAIIITPRFHIVPQFKESISFKQLGLKMDGKTDETSRLRDILSHKGSYFFNPGTLVVSDFIALNSDISITGQDKATSVIEYRSMKNNWLFINGEKGNPDFLTTAGYSGRGNYLFSNFTLNLRGDLARGSRSAFIFGRCENIKLSHLNFINGKNSHRIECNSSRNVLIEHCTFADTLITDNKSHEEINIDFNTPKGFPAYGQWDGSGCRDVMIRNCRFENVQTGIACHSQARAMHKNIYIDNCLFKDNHSYPLKLISFEDTFLSGIRLIDNAKPMLVIHSKNITLRNVADNSGRRIIVKKSTRIVTDIGE